LFNRDPRKKRQKKRLKKQKKKSCYKDGMNDYNGVGLTVQQSMKERSLL
jgi:hypothetical protein